MEWNTNNMVINHTHNIIPELHIQTDHCVGGALRNLIDDAFRVHNMPQANGEEDVQQENLGNSCSFHGENTKNTQTKQIRNSILVAKMGLQC